MKDLIFETMILEATNRVKKLARKGSSLDEAIQIVAEDMELDGSEVQELKTRSKKAPTAKVTEDDLDAAMDDLGSEEGSEGTSDATEGVPDDAIAFGSQDELETALGVLMYKGIPWVEKTDTYIAFQDASFVTKAHDALKRRWDFVNNDERTVAILEFDNLEDYNKVLDFIASKNMTVLKGTNDELKADLDQELAEAEAAHKKAKKDAKETGQPVPEAPNQSMSYTALHKDKLVDVKDLDVFYDNTARCLRVVKRWK